MTDDKEKRIEHLAQLLRREFGGPTEGPIHRRLNSDQWFDEVQIVTVPRFKTSGLSGNEWRTSAHVHLKRKGVVIHTQRLGDVKAAAAWLAWGLMTIGETEDVSLANGHYYCAQPGCPEPVDTFYRIRKLYSWAGEEVPMTKRGQWRGFCTCHSERGDSDMEDSDDNYEYMAGKHPATGTAEGPDARRARFAGTIDLTEEGRE